MNQLFVFLAGFFISCMNYLNSQLSQYTNIYFASFISHFIGLNVILIYGCFYHIKPLEFVKSYYFLSGILGIILTAVTALLNLKIGIIYTTLFSILGQLIFSEIINNNIIVDLKKIISFLCIILGFILIIF